jgi:hypothetical protein
LKSGSMTARTIFVPIATALFLIVSGSGTANVGLLRTVSAASAPAPVTQDCNYFLSSDLDELSLVRWAHIQAPKHNWQRFGYVTRRQVDASIRNALVNGQRYRYGAKLTACQAQVVEYEPNRTPHTITVTYQVVDKKARISDAWILDVG